MNKQLDQIVMTVDPDNIKQLTGSSLCGGVSYQINGAVRDVVNCFCEQCRKTSGHHVAATKVNKDHLRLVEDKNLQWYECLPNVFRGFCNQCGGNLFWENKNADDNHCSIMAGTIDSPTHLKTIANIFTEDASDYSEMPNVETPE